MIGSNELIYEVDKGVDCLWNITFFNGKSITWPDRSCYCQKTK